MGPVVVKPVWQTHFSSEQGCDVARIVAYRAHARDGWTGPSRTTYRAALHDAHEHAHPSGDAA